MVFNFDDSPSSMSADMILFSDASALLYGADDEGWAAAILASGELHLLRTVYADLALVSGGQPGALGGSGLGGVGGRGGGVSVFSGVWLRRGITYTVSIGQSGEPTTISGSDGSLYTAASGQGAAGGTPSSSRGTAPVPGGDGQKIWDGELPIETLADVKYGAGGGAGGYCSTDYARYDPSAGGTTGGGRGGSTASGGNTDAAAGADNTGSGGGGAWLDNGGGRVLNGTPGAGGSGILFFRAHKEVAT